MDKKLYISLILSNFVVEIKSKSQDNLAKLNMRYYNAANEYNLIQKSQEALSHLLAFQLYCAKLNS